MDKKGIKLSFITPTAYIKEFGSQSDFILALSHLMDEKKANTYEKEILQTKLPIILDNGLFENGTPESMETLLEKAVRIGATHVFAPDKLFDSVGTEKSLRKMIRFMEESEHEKLPGLAAVVQADNIEDYMSQLLSFNAKPSVSLIGLSILSIPKSFAEEIGKHDIVQSRVALLREMCDLHQKKGIQWKNCHMLGLGDSYYDVLFAHLNCPWVVSNDTSSAFWNAVQGKRLLGGYCEVAGGKTKVHVDFNYKNLDKKGALLAQENINSVRDMFIKL